MPIFDFFRNIFGGRGPDEHKDDRTFGRRSYSDSFRSPIWEIDEDDDDIDDFRRPGGTMHFSIFTDPFEMTRYFEAQMDSMVKDFFHGFSHNNDFHSFFGYPSTNALPSARPKEESLRDRFLKHDEKSIDHGDDKKVDTDLDGKFTPSEFSNIWGGTNKTQDLQPYVKSQTFGKSVRKEVYRRPDGTVEHKHVTRDSEGNEETTISREIGDKKYIITTRRNKDGTETKTENLINMDESDVKKFTDQWPRSESPSVKRNSILDSFPWETFFGPNPKL